jgi:hypothetical protein
LSSPQLEQWLTISIVLVACLWTFWRLSPQNIFSSTTPTGGDMGAHVWGPAFLRDELLPNFQLRGWSDDWYAGFPAMHFYMFLPYLAIVVVDLFLPYGVAFKLVAVAGVTLMPATAWLLARLSRWPFPLPALSAVAGFLFVFDFNFTIYGGNIASTLAGEFAFSIGLAFTLVYLGLVYRAIEFNQLRTLASVALAVVALCHLVTLIFAIAGTVLMVVAAGIHRIPKLIGVSKAWLLFSGFAVAEIVLWRLLNQHFAALMLSLFFVVALLCVEFGGAFRALTVGVLGGALSAFWVVPFYLRRDYLNDMGWEKLTELRENLFFPAELSGPGSRISITWLLALAGFGALAGLFRWERAIIFLVTLSSCLAIAFAQWPQDRIWNARLLPFWYFTLYLLAAWGFWYLFQAACSQSKEGRSAAPWIHKSRLAIYVAPIVALVVALAGTSLYLGTSVGGSYDADNDFRWGPVSVSAEDRNFVSGWADWNFSGYENRATSETFSDLIQTMREVGKEHGCGRALWEYDKDELGSYGTPMAPMLLPYWTDGCIGSMEGLYFESSQTVPFHFLMQSELSSNPSRPMRDLPYSSLNVPQGVSHMKMSGVRYYLAYSDEAVLNSKGLSEDLEVIAQSGPWTVFLVQDSSIVQALTYEPLVSEGSFSGKRSWIDPAVNWFNDESRWLIPIADDGPEHWSRVSVEEIDGLSSPLRFGNQSSRKLESLKITEVSVSNEEISFEVDEVGIPVIVKTSYFPNWSVSGADGPFRITPNWMVVIPSEDKVELRYGRTFVENFGLIVTMLGILILVALKRHEKLRKAVVYSSGETKI